MGDDLFSVAGVRALVTGASSGLGEHIAGVLAQRGAIVAAAARREDRLAELVAHHPGAITAIPMDVTDPQSVMTGVANAQAALGGLDLLVNCSGVAAGASALQLDEDDWDRVIDTNLSGAWRVSRAFGKALVAAGAPGAIVNIASILGLRVAGNTSAYAASKAGLIQLTRAMALELARHRIRVNALCPGYVETDLNRGFFASEAGARMKARIPTRLGQPADLDGPLLFLASGASAHVTGTALVVDGGHLLSTL